MYLHANAYMALLRAIQLLKDHLQKIKNNYINYLTRKQIGTTLGLFIAEELKEKERMVYFLFSLRWRLGV